MNLITRKSAIAEGLKRYFTGKACKNGHVDYRYCPGGRCVICTEESYIANRERFIEKRMIRYEQNKDDEISYSKIWREKNKQKWKEIHKRWRLNNSDKLAKWGKSWKSENKDKVNSYGQKRRSLKIGSCGSYSNKDVELLLKSQKKQCVDCKKSIKNSYHVDHIFPLILGGTNHKSNIQLLCPKCNLTKGSKHPLDWSRENGKLL